ncbi:TPA: hypothetical protein I7174_20265 [Vibrio vulnificus]|nr:hypothetical protein [Vibrio vulnificus]HDY7944578.1 hypothetical protein [Vibrio vulnificus]
MNNISFKFDVVCVTYKCADIQALKSKIFRLLDFAQVDLGDIIVLDTDIELINDDGTKAANQSNRFFEFSGYHNGFKLSQLNWCDSNERRNIIILNDTIFVSHFFFYYVFILRKAKKIIKDLSFKRGAILGHSQTKFHGKVVPTCFFIVSGSNDILKSLRFMPDNLFEDDGETFSSNDLEVNELYVADSMLFDEHIKSWLYPKSIFRGWYGLDYFEPIKSSVYIRKRTAIYLEHSFLRINSGSFDFVELQDLFILWSNKVDRFYQNILKVTKRVSLYVCRMLSFRGSNR